MVQSIVAVFHDGAFFPENDCHLPEGTRVHLTLSHPQVEPPLIAHPEERKRVMQELIADMRSHPIPADSSKYTRDELHERR